VISQPQKIRMKNLSPEYEKINSAELNANMNNYYFLFSRI